ncbi:copper amine oxidase N-terminal domain-containing protein [Alkaliphilus transvaalensis]|uniref:copper amine oxidase N-terminal domain-containing protein n=1 Tax=Alkaliphilus transvaalensis TaxID=114628 RepID=UPI000479BAFC|nr:copper amine oxidase N-terminal domain-containing protein [Alkaliphilus transvaalensis]
MKKKVSVVVATILILAVLVGCSPVELEMYRLTNEINRLDSTKVSGEIEISMSGSIIDVLELLNPEFKQMYDLTQNLVIRYSGQSSLSQNKAHLAFEYKTQKDGAFKPLTEIIVDQDILYIKVSEIGNLVVDQVANNDDVTAQLIEGFLVDTDYIKIDLKELDENYVSDQKRLVKINEYLSEGLIEAFDGFESGIVYKEGNKYIYELKAKTVFSLLEDVLVYILDNTEKIANAIGKTIDGMDDGDYQYLVESFGYNNSKEVLKKDINKGFSMLLEEQDTILTSFEEFNHEINQSGVLEKLGETGIKYSLEKIDAKSYGVEQEITIDFKDEGSDLLIKIKQQAKIEAVDSVDIKVPTEGVLDLLQELDFGNIVFDDSNFFLLVIEVEDGSYVGVSATDGYEGTIDIHVSDNTTYLPLRAIGEILNEDVSWNNDKKVPFVTKGDTVIELTGIVVEGRSYIKVRDFEKLGYIVDWVPETKSVVIMAQ